MVRLAVDATPVVAGWRDVSRAVAAAQARARATEPDDNDGKITAMAASGVWATVAAFLIWGVFPVYWNWLDHVPALQIMAHRLAWCFVFVAGYLSVRRGPGWWRPIAGNPRLAALLSTSAVLIALNWWLYIWAVTSGHIVEA